MEPTGQLEQEVQQSKVIQAVLETAEIPVRHLIQNLYK